MCQFCRDDLEKPCKCPCYGSMIWTGTCTHCLHEINVTVLDDLPDEQWGF